MLLKCSLVIKNSLFLYRNIKCLRFAFLVVIVGIFCYFAIKGLKMTKEEYLLKCKSVANVLAKIINGEYVSPEERLKDCKDAVELFNYETAQNTQ